jgi:hypothetical protein
MQKCNIEGNQYNVILFWFIPLCYILQKMTFLKVEHSNSFNIFQTMLHVSALKSKNL